MQLVNNFAVRFLIMLFVTLSPLFILAQGTNNLRAKPINASHDTIVIDSLSIIAGSVLISTIDGKAVQSEKYSINFASAMLIWNKDKFTPDDALNLSFIITYRVYPFLFTRAVFNKQVVFIEPDVQGNFDPFIYTYSGSDEDIFKFGGLSKNGSISRGLSFGNNQDVVVNSSLNLQLSGKLSEDVSILAAITDNNIPIQPEGNTQQIQEFDKVYIQLFTKSTHLTAGDFELERPISYFMNLTKKAQGGLLTSRFALKEKNKEIETASIGVTVSGALSKGKYSRNLINGVEGNQGPYKLTGSNGESYIIILAGTEKVYIDGKLLTRGADNDYIIDYNLGEISFTPRNMVTKDKRISIEFEYTDRNYARSMYFASTDYKGKRGVVRFNFFSEQDLRNQPLQQDLTESDKQLLYMIGDSLWLAVIPNMDSVAFSNSEVLYKMVDTIYNSILYDSIFVYSSSPDSAHYRLGFANVGQGNGNYIQVQSSANGRVFRWVAPESGQPQGTHEPVMLLISPKRSQMYTLGGDYRFGKNTKVSAEVAMTNKDENTFSPFSKYDDIGYAARFSFENRLKIGSDSIKGWSIVSGLSHDYVQQYFSPVERFRNVEFARDWNVGSINSRADEQMPGLLLGFENRKNQFLTYRFKSYLKGTIYRGFRHTLDGAYDLKNFYLTINGSYLSSQSDDYNSLYYRQKVSFSKKFKWFTIGVKEEQEHNSLLAAIGDSLTPGSFAFEEYEAFISSPDTSHTRFNANYKRRFDRMPILGTFTIVSTADDASAGVELTKNPANLLKITGTWRNLQIHDSSLSTSQRENTLLGRLEFYTRKFKKVITSNTHYEIGSGLEVKKEFSYVEVPSGQGLFMWTDYNGNGVKELNEFEVAVFTDQANYIRVFTPTNDYLRAYYSQFSEAINIEPAAVWANKKGFRKFISRFSLQANYRIERKTTNNNLLKAYNPFQSSIGDTNLLTLNSSFRGVLFFNRSNNKFGCETGYQDNRSKSLLVNGFDSRIHHVVNAGFRWNITRKLMLTADYHNGKKISRSDYFSDRDYGIQYTDVQPKFSFQPINSFRMSILYKYSYKINKEGNPREKASVHNTGLELKYNILTKGSLLVKANYILIHFNAPENNPLAYEMLEGYKMGNNLTWSLAYQRNLSENLQLNLLYDGRQSPGNKMVHVGSVQLRAYF